jgi:hypothetical protein
MNNEFKILTYPKGRNEYLTYRILHSREFDCRCTTNPDCRRTLVYADTVKSFSRLRTAFNRAISVTSAFRCQKHNFEVGGLANSYHLLGAAMDLRPAGDYTPEDLDTLETLAFEQFDIVLRYEGFIHCHNKGEMSGTIETEYN